VLTVDENMDANNSRSASVTVAGQVARFSQANGCTFRVDTTNANVGSDGGTLSLALTTRDGCAWKVTVSESWIRPLATSGSGSDQVRFEVSPNTGGERHATITIATQRIAVTQSAR
jgi:hypothetical protein